MAGYDNENECKRVSREERARLKTYYASKRSNNQVFRLVESFGPAALEKGEEYLATLVRHMRLNQFLAVTGSIATASWGVLLRPHN